MNLPQLPLGVAVMDEDHYALEQMFAATAQVADADLPSHLQAILEAIRAHFTREEAAMEAIQVPILHCHRGQHTALLAEAERLREACRQADARMRRHVIGFRLARLVADHIASVDAISSQFFNDRSDYSQGEAGC
jgi:hemerythrin-like metal-binding protein